MDTSRIFRCINRNFRPVRLLCKESFDISTCIGSVHYASRKFHNYPNSLLQNRKDEGSTQKNDFLYENMDDMRIQIAELIEFDKKEKQRFIDDLKKSLLECIKKSLSNDSSEATLTIPCNPNYDVVRQGVVNMMNTISDTTNWYTINFYRSDQRDGDQSYLTIKINMGSLKSLRLN